MNLRKRLLARSRFYAILDKQAAGRRPLDRIAVGLAQGGVHIVQVRDKLASRQTVFEEVSEVRHALAGKDVLVIVNDYPDIALITGSDGAHLGQDDFPVGLARKLLGPGRIIGVSCHSYRQALKAQKDGADYIGIGPIFPTPTKPDYTAIGPEVLTQLAGVLKIPFFAIGNIHCGNAAEVASYGASRFAVCRDFIAHRDVRSAVRRFTGSL